MTESVSGVQEAEALRKPDVRKLLGRAAWEGVSLTDSRITLAKKSQIALFSFCSDNLLIAMNSPPARVEEYT